MRFTLLGVGLGAGPVLTLNSPDTAVAPSASSLAGANRPHRSPLALLPESSRLRKRQLCAASYSGPKRCLVLDPLFPCIPRSMQPSHPPHTCTPTAPPPWAPFLLSLWGLLPTAQGRFLKLSSDPTPRDSPVTRCPSVGVPWGK